MVRNIGCDSLEELLRSSQHQQPEQDNTRTFRIVTQSLTIGSSVGLWKTIEFSRSKRVLTSKKWEDHEIWQYLGASTSVEGRSPDIHHTHALNSISYHYSYNCCFILPALLDNLLDIFISISSYLVTIILWLP